MPLSRWSARLARRREDQEECSDLVITVATANVQTLDPKEYREVRRLGGNETLRMRFVEAYFARHGFDVIGVQETRLDVEGCST